MPVTTHAASFRDLKKRIGKHRELFHKEAEASLTSGEEYDPHEWAAVAEIDQHLEEIQAHARQCQAIAKHFGW